MAWSDEKTLEVEQISALPDSKNAIYRILLPIGLTFELKKKHKISPRAPAPKPPWAPKLPYKTKISYE